MYLHLIHGSLGPQSGPHDLPPNGFLIASARGVTRSNKLGWTVLVRWEGCPSQVGGRVWGYNLKLTSTLHNDSIPETRWGKSGVDVSIIVHPVMATPLVSAQHADHYARGS